MREKELAELLSAGECDAPPASIGSSPENPYLIAPLDFDSAGLPYGAYCCCVKCGLVARSTIGFDYYAAGPGAPLHCESCEMTSLGQKVKP